MKIKISRSKKSIIFYSIGLIILFVIVVLFVYDPLINNTIKKRGRLMMSERTLRRYTSEIDAVKNIEEENNTLQKELSKYTGIKEEKMTSFIFNSLLKASNRSGVEFISIDPLDIREKDGFKYLKLEAKTKSGFHELGKFISEIRRLNGLFFVDNIEIENKDKMSDVITSKLEISVYILSEE